MDMNHYMKMLLQQQQQQQRQQQRQQQHQLPQMPQMPMPFGMGQIPFLPYGMPLPMPMSMQWPSMAMQMPTTSGPLGMPFPMNRMPFEIPNNPAGNPVLIYERVTMGMPAMLAVPEVNRTKTVRVEEEKDEAEEGKKDGGENVSGADRNEEKKNGGEIILRRAKGKEEKKDGGQNISEAKAEDEKEESGEAEGKEEKREERVAEGNEAEAYENKLPMSYEWGEDAAVQSSASEVNKSAAKRKDRKNHGGPSKRVLRSGTREEDVAITESQETEEILKELERVPLRLPFQEEHLEIEAVKILEILTSKECSEHLKKVAEGLISRDQSMMKGGGMGPFNLYDKLQMQLLDLLERFSYAGPLTKIQVLLPEAIIYGYMKMYSCSWEDGLDRFAASSKIVARCL